MKLLFIVLKYSFIAIRMNLNGREQQLKRTLGLPNMKLRSFNDH